MRSVSSFRSNPLFLAALVLAPIVAQAGNAHAKERPITTIQWVDSSMADIAEPNSHTSKLVFLNRCQGGCTIKSGFTDSRTNHSSILRNGTANVSEWGKGDAQWNALVKCVTALYDPYDITITDVDPGPNVEHFEAIVAGRASELGLQPGVGGISPFTCGIINNAITFNFANSDFYSNGIKGICETVGQETAHAFGLEHEYLCTDPMTYLSDCGLKWFQNENASCGEFSPRSCQCRVNQNSHRMLEDHFGPGDSPGPNVQIVRPIANSNVDPNFVIEVTGDDYYFGLKNVEVLVNGTSLGTSSSAPYIFNAPEGTGGFTTIEVRGTDARGIESKQSIEVNVGENCSSGNCPGGRVCLNNFCVADSTTAGGFASSCDTDSTCNSDLCAKDSDGVGICTEVCELDQGQCPAGFGCFDTGAKSICWAGVEESTGGCGCSSTDPSSGLLAGLFVFLGLFYQRRRKSSEVVS